MLEPYSITSEGIIMSLENTFVSYINMLKSQFLLFHNSKMFLILLEY